MARGVDATYENAQGVRTGRVLAGGSVVLAAGSLHLRAGSLIDVSGTSGRIDGVPGAGGTAFAARPVVTLASDGGAISIHGSGVVEGRLRGHAGGVGAAGARLDVAFAPPLVDPNGSPAEQVQQTLMSMDPDCYGIAGDGVCGTGDWKEALGVDWQPFFRDFWGIPVETPVILPVELITMASGGNRFIVSDSAPGSTEPKLPRDPAEFGLTPEVLDLFRDYMIYTDALREIFQEPTQDYAMVFRPGAMADGGFADLALAAAPHRSGSTASRCRWGGRSPLMARSCSMARPRPVLPRRSSRWPGHGPTAPRCGPGTSRWQENWWWTRGCWRSTAISRSQAGAAALAVSSRPRCVRTTFGWGAWRASRSPSASMANW